MFTEIRRAETFDLTTLSVALRQLRNLALDSPHAPDPIRVLTHRALVARAVAGRSAMPSVSAG